jgi:hypothetical protein
MEPLAHDEPAHWSVRFGMSARVAHSAIDAPMYGADVFALLRLRPGPPFALRFSGGYALSPTLDAPPGQARFSLPQGSMQGCLFGLERNMVSIGPCVGARGGVLLASGSGVDRPGSAARAWLAWIGGLRAEMGPALGWRAELAAGLAVSQTRYTYIFDRPPVTISDPPSWGWELSFGLLLPAPR